MAISRQIYALCIGQRGPEAEWNFYDIQIGDDNDDGKRVLTKLVSCVTR